MLLSAAARQDQEEDDVTRWDKAEADLVVELYGQPYVDSVKLAKGVGENRGLGDPVAVPYRREKLVFDGGWGFLRAGWAILFAEADEEGGIYNFIGKVLSNNFVSAFYKVRDYVHAYCDMRSLYPLFFEQHIEEGRYRDHRWTLFDHNNHKLYYLSKKGELESPAEPGIQNYLSVLYVLRTMGLAVGDTFSIRTYYHRKDFPIHFTVRDKEKVEVPAGTFDCFRVEPRLVGEGRGFTKRDKLEVWIADDEWRTPVLVKAKINIGSLSARLLHCERE
jgi:hypothetical protein